MQIALLCFVKEQKGNQPTKSCSAFSVFTLTKKEPKQLTWTVFDFEKNVVAAGWIHPP